MFSADVIRLSPSVPVDEVQCFLVRALAMSERCLPDGRSLEAVWKLVGGAVLKGEGEGTDGEQYGFMIHCGYLHRTPTKFHF